MCTVTKAPGRLVVLEAHYEVGIVAKGRVSRARKVVLVMACFAEARPVDANYEQSLAISCAS